MIVKVCGINTLEDALRCVQWGANALGFNFYFQSPRYIHPEKAFRIVEQLPEAILSVGILVRDPARPDRKGLDFPLDPLHSWPDFQLAMQAVQLYGLDSECQIPETDRRTFVATTIKKLPCFPNREVVIDSSWGTGRREDWEALRQLHRPFILSGGLTPENVAEAIRRLRPAGVDVCSGVESAPGKKDPNRLRAFLEAVSSVAPDE